MLLNNITCQDFVAMDLIDDNGEYDPGFDSHLAKLPFKVVLDPTLDFDQWIFKIAESTIIKWHGVQEQ